MNVSKPVFGLLAALAGLGVLSTVSDILVLVDEERSRRSLEKVRIRAANRSSYRPPITYPPRNYD